MADLLKLLPPRIARDVIALGLLIVLLGVVFGREAAEIYGALLGGAFVFSAVVGRLH